MTTPTPPDNRSLSTRMQDAVRETTARQWLLGIVLLFVLAILASNELITRDWAQVILAALGGGVLGRASK